MSWPRSNPRAWVAVLVWVAVVMLCSQGCLCIDLLPHDRGASNVAGAFAGEPERNTRDIAQLTGMSVKVVEAIEKIRYQGWMTTTWVDSDLAIIPAWYDSVEIDGWFNMTQRVNQRSFTGRYRMTVTSGKNSADPSAGSGFGGTFWTKVSNVRLVERLERPKAPEGVTAILPGQCVEGVFEEGGPHVHHYLVVLPAGKKGRLNANDGDITTQGRVLKGGLELPLRNEYDVIKPFQEFGSNFDTGLGGEFIIEITPLPDVTVLPRHYGFVMYWGAPPGCGCR